MALTDAQMANVRRYAGYPLYGTTSTLGPDNDTVYMAFGMVTMSLYKRLTTLSASEESVLVTYLTTLATLETAIPTTSDNLDTDQAAVWHHNKRELADRTALFDSWARRMCAFLGLDPGPGLCGGNNIPLVRS